MIPQISITVWSGSDATDFEKLKRGQGPDGDPGDAGDAAARKESQPVRVVGKFRGRNLYGDLPSKSQRRERRLGHQGRRVRGLGDRARSPRAGAGSSTPA